MGAHQGHRGRLIHTQLSRSSSSKGVLAVIRSGGIGFNDDAAAPTPPTPPPTPLLNVEVAVAEEADEGGGRCGCCNVEKRMEFHSGDNS